MTLIACVCVYPLEADGCVGFQSNVAEELRGTLLCVYVCDKMCMHMCICICKDLSIIKPAFTLITKGT